jgi:hypothetical protein
MKFVVLFVVMVVLAVKSKKNSKNVFTHKNQKKIKIKIIKKKKI